MTRLISKLLLTGRWRSFLTVSIVSIAMNLAAHSHIRSAALNKYADDSIHTLGTAAALGLVVICTVLLTIVLMLSWLSTIAWIKYSSKKSVLFKLVLYLLNLAVAVVVYSLMLVIAPQIFYTYYQLIFSGLPVQWVVKPMTLEVLFNLVSLQPGESMADHLAGFTLWVLMLNITIQWVLNHKFATE